MAEDRRLIARYEATFFETHMHLASVRMLTAYMYMHEDREEYEVELVIDGVRQMTASHITTSLADAYFHALEMLKDFAPSEPKEIT